MMTYRTDAILSAADDPVSSGPPTGCNDDAVLIVRTHGTGPRCGEREIVEGDFISAEECEAECDRAFNRIPVEARPVPRWNTSAYRIYRDQMRAFGKRGAA
jgi:hypothetical protein